MNGRYATHGGWGTLGAGGPGATTSGWYDLLKDHLSERFRLWMDASHIDGQTLADEVNRWGKKRGSTATRQTISAYRTGRAMPRWFLRFLDEHYADWRQTSDGHLNDVRKKLVPRDTEGAVRVEPMFLIPDIDATDYLSMLKTSSLEGSWKGPTSLAPDFLGRKIPIQRIRNTAYAPTFRVGDALLLLPNADPVEGRLYAVTNPANGLSSYAALIPDSNGAVWEAYDGTLSPFDERVIDAAVIMHLPQYSAVEPEGTFSPRGLRVGQQVAWPKK